MNNSLNQITKEAKSILILLPTNPSLDQVAAGLSLHLGMGQDTLISCPSPMLVEFNRLVGVDRITSELGNKNLSITFADYPADNVEKVSYDIIEGQFKLSVIPKAQFVPPKQDQVILSYSGISADLIILIGGQNENHFPAIKSKELENTKVVHIGTQQVSIGRDVSSFASPSSSISELVAKILKENDQKIDSDMATNLLMGIEEATKSFTTREVGADTFATVAELMKSGGRRYVASLEPKREQFPAGAIPGLPYNRPQNFTPVTQPAPPQQNPGGKVPKSWLEPKIFKGTNVS
jgi:hypothetical protein